MAQSLTPSFLIANEARERERFLADPTYNPQFVYQKPIETFWLDRYPNVEATLFALAEHISAQTNKLHPTYVQLRAAEGDLLNSDSVHKQVADYISQQHLNAQQVAVQYSKNFMARTGVNVEQRHCVVKIKLPLTYRERSFRAVLDHEIGTHVFRWINEFERPWCEKRSEYQLLDHVETEEGLAILHSHLTYPIPYMWQPAMYVISVKLAETNSFAQVFAKLERYCDDPAERWRLAVRVKRGLTDTSQPGGYRKDALYLRGAVKISRWLAQHEFDPRQLYMGKVSLEDSERLLREVRLDQVQLPNFIGTPQYAQQIAHTCSINGFNQLPEHL